MKLKIVCWNRTSESSRLASVALEGKKKEPEFKVLFGRIEVEATSIDFRLFCGGRKAHVVSYKEKSGEGSDSKGLATMEVDPNLEKESEEIEGERAWPDA